MTLGIISFVVSFKLLNEPSKEQNYTVLEEEYIELNLNDNSNIREWDEPTSSSNTLTSRINDNDTAIVSNISDNSTKKELGFLQSIKIVFTKSSWIAIICYCMLSLATMLFFTVSTNN